MADFFSTLSLPRQPWLDSDTVREAFQRRSAVLHPDVPGSGDAAAFAELNAAYVTLRDPAPRLRHLLELLAPETLTTNPAPPAELGNLFMQIGSWQQRAANLLQRQASATAPLAKALLAGEKESLKREFEAIRTTLQIAWDKTEARIRGLVLVETNDEKDEAARLYHRLVYLGRWQEQIREAALRWS